MSGGPKAPKTQKDNLFSQDLVEMVISFGEGVVWGLADGLKGFYVGNEPVMDDSTGQDVYNFPDFSLSMRQGYEDDLPVDFVLGGEASIVSGSSGQVLSQGVPRTVNTQSSLRGKIRAVDIRLAVQSLVSGDKSGATSKRACVFRIDYKKSSATEWVRVGNKTTNDLLLSGDRKDWLIVKAFELGFPDAANEWTNGQWDLFEEQWANIEQYQRRNINQEVRSREPSEESTWQNHEYAVIPKATWVAGTIPEGGSPNFRAEYSANPLSFNVIYGKTTSGYIWELRVPLPIIPDDDDDWQIRVTRISADIPLDDQYNSANITLDSITSIAQEEVVYPRVCVAHIVAQHSNRFSEIPDFSCELMGILCDVPTNYNPFLGTYEGAWLGGYKKSWTNNPVWILRELIMNIDWGDRSREPNIQISDPSFYEAAQYCDEPIRKFKIDQGGITEYVRRHTFNAVIQEYRSSEDLKRYIAGSFRSVLSEVNGKYYLNTDKERTPNFFVSPEIVTSELFTYSATDLSSRYNFMRVSFQNAENRYEEDNRVITNQEAIDRYGVISNDMQAVGATNLDEALRQGAFNMMTNLKETIMASFKIPRLGLYLKQYDNFYIADRTCGWGDSGRVYSFSDGLIKVLTPITTNTGDCVLIFHTLTGLEPFLCTQLDPFTFRINSATTEFLPQQDQPFILSSETAGNPKLFRLMSVKDEGQGRGYIYSVEASEVFYPKYDLIDNLDSETSGLSFSIDRLIYKNKDMPPKPISADVVLLDFFTVGNSRVFEISIEMPQNPPDPRYKYQVAFYNDGYPNERQVAILEDNISQITVNGSLVTTGAMTFEITVLDQFQRGGETYYLLKPKVEYKVGYEQVKFSSLITDLHDQKISIGWKPIATFGLYNEVKFFHKPPLGVNGVFYPLNSFNLSTGEFFSRQMVLPYVSSGLHFAQIEYNNETEPDFIKKEKSQALSWLENSSPLVFTGLTHLGGNRYLLEWEPVENPSYKTTISVALFREANPNTSFVATFVEDIYNLNSAVVNLGFSISGERVFASVDFAWEPVVDSSGFVIFNRFLRTNKSPLYIIP